MLIIDVRSITNVELQSNTNLTCGMRATTNNNLNKVLKNTGMARGGLCFFWFGAPSLIVCLIGVASVGAWSTTGRGALAPAWSPRLDWEPERSDAKVRREWLRAPWFGRCCGL